MSRAERDIRRVVGAVRRSISLVDVDLPGEFYPAHLSVALIDAVFRPRLGAGTVTVLERYCSRFGISRLRTRQWETPPPDGQEPLYALVRHHEELGMEAMVREIYLPPGHPDPTSSRDAETVLDAARALRGIGIDIFQDVARLGSDEIEYALRTRAGTSEPSARRFLMYTANDDFVRGDLAVRRFVAQALGLQAVSAVRARKLVRGAAHELILSPRFLDCRIWMFGTSDAGTIPPPEPASEK